MNANKLADELINWYPKVNLCVASAITLRQQDKEIELLYQSYEILFKHRIEQEKENQFLKKEIKDLRQIVEGTIKQAFYEDDYHKATVKIELLKANLRDVAERLRTGLGKLQQKTLARVIEHLLEGI